MKIETAHKILIGAAVAFFAFFAAIEAVRFARSGEAAAGLMAAGGIGAAAVFGVYLRGYVRGLRRAGEGSPASPARKGDGAASGRTSAPLE